MKILDIILFQQVIISKRVYRYCLVITRYNIMFYNNLLSLYIVI